MRAKWLTKPELNPVSVALSDLEYFYFRPHGCIKFAYSVRVCTATLSDVGRFPPGKGDHGNTLFDWLVIVASTTVSFPLKGS